MITRIKICGITRQEDADAVVRAGAQAMGLVFAAASPRRIDVDRARVIARQVRGAVTRVGLFVDPDPEDVSRVLDAVELDVLQFHGSEPASFCRGFGLPYIKTIRMRGPLPLETVEDEFGDACCLLLDTYVEGKAGGTGECFDWTLWPQGSRLPLVLAGGLTPDNVAAAVARLRPWGVDVSGGVEGDRRGVKDPDRIRRFAEEVNGARS
jgi:phosphoribosylanthranilate isomerase